MKYRSLRCWELLWGRPASGAAKGSAAVAKDTFQRPRSLKSATCSGT